MHKTITGVFTSGATAELAASGLKRCGFEGHEISVLASDRPYDDEDASIDDLGPDSEGVLVGVSVPDDLVDVAERVLRRSGATCIEVS